MGRTRKVTSQPNRGKSQQQQANKSIEPAKSKNAPSSISFNETFFRALVEHNSNAITLFNSEGAVIYDSPAASGMLGYSPTEWIGKTIFELIHPDDLQEVQTLFANLLKKKSGEASAIFRVRHKDNHWVWIDIVATNLLAQPNVQAIVVNYRDITQLKQAEETLSQIEERFKQVWDVTNEAMVLSDAEGTVLAANPAYYNLYGYKPEQVIGQSFAIIFPKDIRQYAQEQYKKIFKSDVNPTPVEALVQHADGTERIVESRASFLTSAGQRIAMLSIIRDITEHKQVQEKIAYQVNLLKHINDAVIAVNSQFQITAWNHAAEKMYGWSTKEVIGRLSTDILPSNLTPEKRGEILKDLQEFGSYRVELIQYRKDGQPIHIETNTITLYDEHKQVMGILSVNRDITKRKQAEEELQTSRQMYANLMRNLTGAVYRSRNDPQWTVEYISEGCHPLTGYAPDELIESRITSLGALMHRDDVSPVWEKCQINLARHQSCSNEYRIYHRDGSIRWVWDQAQGVYSEQGELLHIEGLLTDITERKHVEEKLRASENFRRLIVNTEPECVKLIAPDGGLIEMNAAGLAMIEADSLEQIRGVPMIEIVAPEYRNVFGNLHKRVMRGETGMLEFEIIGLKGKRRWLETHAVPFRNASNQIEALLGVTRDITERKRAEEALLENQQRLQLFFDQSLDGFFFSMLDEPQEWNDSVKKEAVIEYVLIHQHITEVNDAMLLQYGATRENFIGRTPLEFFAHDVDQVRRFRRRLFDAGRLHLETQERREDGMPIWIEGDYVTIRDEQNRIKGIFGIQRDITERKKVEEAVRESESYLRLILESALDAFISMDSQGMVLEWNPQAQAIFGWSRHEAVGKKLAELIIPEDLRERHQRGLQIFLATGKGPLLDKHTEISALHQNGNLFPVELTITQVSTASGLTFSAFIRDITARKQAEEKLERQNERLKVLREIDTAILAADSMENIVDAGLSHIRELIGCRRASLTIIDWAANEAQTFDVKTLNETLIPQGTRIPLARFQDMIQILSRNETVLINDLSLLKDPPPQLQNIIAEGLRSLCILPLFSQSSLIGAFSISSEMPGFFDKEKINLGREIANQIAIAITQNNLFSQLRELNANLEQRVNERTAQLNQTNQKLESANRTRDEFLANMSHELRTPLNSILGLSEYLLEQHQGTLNETQQKSLQIIETSGRHLLDLINDILDLSKMQAGKFDYYPELVNVLDLCKSSIIFIKSQAIKKSINLTYKIEENLSDVYADPRRLKQILINLLTNAVKFTPNEGMVTLKVDTNAEKNVIKFSVIDTGIGIAPEDLRRLFKPFIQVDSSLNRQFEGTGLGLALVQTLTDLHGGSIEVESEINKGSRFTINLPYQQENGRQSDFEIETPVSYNKDTEGDFESQQNNHIKKILLVEDNESNILTIGEYLENYGYKIITANDGLQAIEKANENKPDIILMDMQMPVLDGLEATRRLRADPQFVSVPIIALTALAMPGDRERCLEAGASEYMSKPVSLKELRGKIQALVK